MIDVMICQTCRQVLSKHTRGQSVHYEHGEQDLPNNHPAIPIEAPADYLGRCDFCNGGIPAYLVPARDFRLPGSETDWSQGDWAACVECAPLIERNEWSALIRRIVDLYEPAHGYPMSDIGRSSMRAMYRSLRKNITGPLRPMG